MLTILISIIVLGTIGKVIYDSLWGGLFWGLIIGLIIAFALQ